MKRIAIISIIMALPLAMMAQNAMDAYIVSSQQIKGTARYVQDNAEASQQGGQLLPMVHRATPHKDVHYRWYTQRIQDRWSSQQLNGVLQIDHRFCYRVHRKQGELRQGVRNAPRTEE